MKKTRLWLGTGAVALLAGVAVIIGQAQAVEKDQIKKIAEMIKKGDTAGAKKAAEAYAKKNTDVDELMTAFKPAKKGGMMEPGIEQTLIKVGRDAPTATAIAKSAGDFTDMGYYTAAVGMVTEAAAPAKDMGKKSRKDWIEWAKTTQEGGLKLAEAGKAKSAAGVKDAASKINNACNSCHTVFR
jgi:hypothetical protein